MPPRPTLLVGISMHPQASRRLAGEAQVIPIPPDGGQVTGLIEEADGMIVYSPSFDPALLSIAVRLKVIACHACSPAMREAARPNCAG